MKEFIELYLTDMKTFLFGSLLIPIIIALGFSIFMLIKTALDK